MPVIYDVPSEPYKELTFRSDKLAGLKNELHLAGRNITRLVDFEAFTSLDCLWLNENQLTSLRGLENNFRIKCLYVHNNKLKRIKGSLELFKFLNTLTLNGNLLSDIEDVIDELKKLKYLKTLSLFSNPIAQEDNYRLRIIAEIPWLETLDRIAVTEEEIVEAKIFKKNMKKLQNYKFKSKKPPKTDQEIDFENEQQALLTSCFSKLRERIQKRRIFLEPQFILYDARKLGIIDENQFMSILKENALYDLTTEIERKAVLYKYEMKLNVDAISETTKMLRKGVCYKKFCFDLLPVHLRSFGDGDDWVPTQQPELSKTGMDLKLYVDKIKKNKIKQEETLRRTALLASSTSATASSSSSSTYPTKSNSSSFERQGLDPWLGGELNKIIKSMNLPNKILKEEDVKNIFDKMEQYFGKVPVLGKEIACEVLFKSNNSSSSSSSSSLSQQTEIQIDFFRQAVGFDLVSNNKMPLPPPKIMWRDLNAAEINSLKNEMFRSASDHFQQLMRAKSTEDSKKIFESTFNLSNIGTRLSSQEISKKELIHANNTTTTTNNNNNNKNTKSTTTSSSFNPNVTLPAKIMHNAPTRSDFIVLPRLHTHNNNVNRSLNNEDENTTTTTTTTPPSFSWSKEFEMLGLKGEELVLAVERKKRSIQLAKKEEAKRVKDQSNSNNHNKSSSSSPTNKKPSKKMMSVLEIMKNPPPPPKGWNQFTGSVVLPSTDRRS